ncbi:ATP-binding protein [Streptomyces sp. BI20]|uniref:ATP-binding protein n=1 Tax=Streptomyces sp. BI20 TaxID=3403460 RepID=UPI003C7786DF
MPEPTRLGNEAAMRRMHEILRDRGMQIPSGGALYADPGGPQEPGSPEWHRQTRTDVAVARWRAATPPQYAEATATAPAVRDWVRAMLEGPSTPQSLVLTGPVGRGKTWEAYGALRALAEAPVPNFGLLAVRAADMYASLRPTATPGSAEIAMGRLCRVPYLLIDDLGAGKWSEAVHEASERIFFYRYDHRLPTVITSNLPPRSDDGEDLVSWVGDRVASRLAQTARIVAMLGPDRRRLEGAA